MSTENTKMATNIPPPKQASHLKCPLCLDNMQEPIAFSCSHLFCQKCIDDMKLIDGQSAPTIECLICERPTIKDEIRPMDSIKELMEAVRASKQLGHVRCDKCKNKTQAVSRCLDCKQNFCTPCHDGHNSYAFLENHKWEKLSEDTKVIIDKHIYCRNPEHSGELVKLFCNDCDLLICMLCGVTKHKTHEVETITKTITTALESNKEHQNKIADLIEENEKVLEYTTVKGEERKKKYEDMVKEAENKCEEIIRKARDDCKEVKKQIQDMRNKEFRKVERFRKQIEVAIQSQQNMKILAEGVCANARGTSLLQLLQGGVGKSVESTSKEAAKETTNLFEVCPMLKTKDVPKENLIGIV